MQRDSITPTRQYAIRERVSIGEPLQRVEVIEHARGTKWKVRFLDEPNPGLVDYVTSKQIICTWTDRRKYTRDEERLAALEALDGNVWDGHPREQAVSLVLLSTGERGAEVYRGRLSITPDRLQRIMARAGLEGTVSDLDPMAFVDRHGEVQVPFRGAERSRPGVRGCGAEDCPARGSAG